MVREEFMQNYFLNFWNKSCVLRIQNMFCSQIFQQIIQVARTKPALKAVKKMAAGKKVLAKKVELKNQPN